MGIALFKDTFLAQPNVGEAILDVLLADSDTAVAHKPAL